MFNHRLYFNTFPFFQNDYMILKGHCSFAINHVKKLPRPFVIVHDFRASSRDTFLDHAHVSALEQVPASAVLTPDVMFRIFDGNHQKAFSPLGVRRRKRLNLHSSVD
jgi:hypothetical protein